MKGKSLVKEKNSPEGETLFRRGNILPKKKIDEVIIDRKLSLLRR